MDVLSSSEWQRQRETDLGRLRPEVEAHLSRASRHEKHPVMDFLFQYFSFRPSQLMNWSPGIGVLLEDNEAARACRPPRSVHGGRQALAAKTLIDWPDWMTPSPDGWQVDISVFPEKRLRGLEWVIQLLEAVEKNPPRFGCHGLHEWAMVYKASDKQVRHYSFPLRLPMDDIVDVVNTHPIQCTHYDAFRFFTPEAAPLNQFQPRHGNRFDLEQSGCIHVNMDLYKWAYKYHPWIPTALIADAFELAVDARSVDMRASPYDLRNLGYDPIPIETPAGREQYQTEQRRLQALGSTLRTRLLEKLRGLYQKVNIGGTVTDRAHRQLCPVTDRASN